MYAIMPLCPNGKLNRKEIYVHMYQVTTEKNSYINCVVPHKFESFSPCISLVSSFFYIDFWFPERCWSGFNSLGMCHSVARILSAAISKERDVAIFWTARY